jgi:hypothetical protein
VSEEAPKSEPMPDTGVSPLRGLMTEFHEIYQELKAVGFTEQVATSILAQMVSDVMLYRTMGEQESEDFYDNDDDESDNNNERGLD